MGEGFVAGICSLAKCDGSELFKLSERNFRFPCGLHPGENLLVNLNCQCVVEVRERIAAVLDQVVVLPRNMFDTAAAPGRALAVTPVAQKSSQTNPQEFSEAPFPAREVSQRILASKPLHQEIVRGILGILWRKALKPHPMRDGVAILAAELLEGAAGLVRLRDGRLGYGRPVGGGGKMESAICNVTA